MADQYRDTLNQRYEFSRTHTDTVSNCPQFLLYRLVHIQSHTHIHTHTLYFTQVTHIKQHIHNIGKKRKKIMNTHTNTSLSIEILYKFSYAQYIIRANDIKKGEEKIKREKERKGK